MVLHFPPEEPRKQYARKSCHFSGSYLSSLLFDIGNAMGPITRKNNYISGAIFKGEDAVRQKQSPTIMLPLPFASLGIPLVNGGARSQEGCPDWQMAEGA